MGRKEPVAQIQFRKAAKAERLAREWSQAEMAEMLKLKGVDHVYTSLLAKIENGQREVKLDEAVAIADLLGLSIDTLLGRTPSSPESDTVYALRLLAGTSEQWCRQVWGMSEALPSSWPR